ncbi:isocitrate lyase/PEP mutase family protein [Desulfosporosinus lacus]|uniref:2,3-dimethylmalate lyase n=1 Tax=Desulfosporosinus lacus DSM 15449 TaxID=1121420 RepID=A0A1M5ZSL1_9FIRM|nr:isocitrate lyase/PEP mutase family protein [Desulfosporosinus lacus]SHI27191.1 2,3-dimethylmalate lyase [Desulfosporosinus lacus DSM 15449]
MTNAKKLRTILTNGFQVIPGGYDAFSMALVETVGFKAGYLGGYSLAASITRTPDWGFITQTEMINAAINSVNAVNMPIICDIDQGFGALSNFARTIHAYENAGVAGVHFEDQFFPKKCGMMPGRTVIPLEENVRKIKAALEIRNDPDFVLITRTDSQATEGLDGVLRRFDAYLKAGADYGIYFEAQSEEELRIVAKEFPGRIIAFIADIPHPAHPLPFGHLPFAVYEEMGYAGVINCAAAFGAAHKAVKALYQTMMDSGQLTLAYFQEHCCTYFENNEISRINDWEALRQKYDML